MNEELLRRSILQTLAYFDLANFPLTKEELFVFLWQPPPVKYEEFLMYLQKSGSATLGFESVGGYFFLSGRKETIEKRQRSLIISEQKLKIACRAARLIRSVPFLKAVFVCNTVASEQAGEDSDIDFFIIAASNRIWITRLLVTFILQIFGLRRTKTSIKNKICLSFYITEDNLDLSGLRAVDDDIHFIFWLNQMVPIFDPYQYHARFLQANSWVKKYVPHINFFNTSSYILNVVESKLGAAWKIMWEKMWHGSYGTLINTEAKKIQLSKMKFSGNSIDRKGDTNVVISDSVLKFHEKDTRLEYRAMWQRKIN